MKHVKELTKENMHYTASQTDLYSAWSAEAGNPMIALAFSHASLMPFAKEILGATKNNSTLEGFDDKHGDHLGGNTLNPAKGRFCVLPSGLHPADIRARLEGLLAEQDLKAGRAVQPP